MKKLLLLLLAVPLLTHAEEGPKVLHYKYNQNVVISIAHVACPFNAIKKEFPYGAVASRIDGEKLFGCFNHEGDTIVIQWNGGDKTRIPADYFLQPPAEL